MPFVDSFAAFLSQSELFKHDHLSPNHTGSHVLSTNTQLTLHSCKPFKSSHNVHPDNCRSLSVGDILPSPITVVINNRLQVQ